MSIFYNHTTGISVINSLRRQVQHSHQFDAQPVNEVDSMEDIALGSVVTKQTEVICTNIIVLQPASVEQSGKERRGKCFTAIV